jgi:hypothetical protein
MPEVPSKTCAAIRQLQMEESARSYLDDGAVSCIKSVLASNWLSGRLTSGLEDLPRSLGAIRQRQGYDLVVLWEFDLERTL